MHGRISVKTLKNIRPARTVTLRIRRYKKRGHNHEMVETRNTRKQVVMRCKICKHHFYLYTSNT